MKSWNHTVNVFERVEVSRKTTQATSATKRVRTAIAMKDNTLNKRPRKEKTRALRKTVKVSQPVVE
jgi:hypothetical protein